MALSEHVMMIVVVQVNSFSIVMLIKCDGYNQVTREYEHIPFIIAMMLVSMGQ